MFRPTFRGTRNSLQMLAPPLFASRSFWFLLSDFDEGSADAISGFVFFGFGNLVGVIKTNPWPNVLFNSGFACSRFRFGFSSKYTGATPCFWHNRKYSPLVMVLIIVMPSMLEITSTSMIGFDLNHKDPPRRLVRAFHRRGARRRSSWRTISPSV